MRTVMKWQCGILGAAAIVLAAGGAHAQSCGVDLIFDNGFEAPAAGGAAGGLSTAIQSPGLALGIEGPDLTGRANPCNTGPRYACTSTFNGNFTTSSDGQTIEGMCIHGELRIQHNNVTVRDTTVTSGGLYGIDIGYGVSACPANTLIEYTEVDKSPAPGIPWGVYQRCPGGQTFDHVKIHHVGRGMMIYGNITVRDSYVYSDRTIEGAHRTAISTHGGDNFTMTGNTFICVDTGCSSSVNMYSDYAPVTNYLLQNNLVAGGSICVRGGQTHNYPNDTHDIRILNNRFSTVYYPECGIYQALGQFDATAPGNIRSGNVWHENGQPITGE